MSTPSIDTSNLSPEALRLGNPLTEYSYATGSNLVGGLVLLLLSGAICGIGGIFYQGKQMDLAGLAVMLSCGVLALIGAAYVMYVTLRDRGLRVIVFEKGFVRNGSGQDEVVAWDDVSMVYQEITERYRNGIKIGTIHKYSLQLKNKNEITLGDTIKDVEALGKTIQNETASRLLPKCVEALQAGKMIPFGKLTISRSGIGNGKETISWDEVQEVKIVQGKISVRKQGKWLDWAGQTAGETPNLYVFLTLVDQIVGINQKRMA